MPHVATARTAEEAWSTIQDMYAAKSRANTINTRIALANTENDMIAAGKPLDAEDMVAYTLAGLDCHYDGLVAAIGARVEPITVSDLFSQLMFFEHRLVLHQTPSQSSANAAMRGGGRGRFGGRGRGDRGGYGRGYYGGRNAPRSEKKGPGWSV